MLSMLIYDSPEGEVKGINELQEQYIQQYGYDDYIPKCSFYYSGALEL